jgi:hypothetical protein
MEFQGTVGAYRTNPSIETLRSLSTPISEGLGTREERLNRAGLHHFNHYASWNNTTTTSLAVKFCNPHIYIGCGFGQLSAPFSTSCGEFESSCGEMGFLSPSCKNLCKGSLVRAQHGFDTLNGAPSGSSIYLEIIMKKCENYFFFCLFRYSIEGRNTRCLPFLKAMDHRRESETPSIPSSLVEWFDDNKVIIGKHPLLTLNIILQFV